jgi:GxxExxY protein
MDADTQIDLHAPKMEFPLKAETHAIIGCAFDVLNELGHGLNEKCYENALTVEFKLRGIAFDQQRRFEVTYKGQRIGEFIPDLIVFGQVIVHAKVIEQITDREREQMMNFLRIAQLPVGLILNFKFARLGWERIVLSTADKRR